MRPFFILLILVIFLGALASTGAATSGAEEGHIVVLNMYYARDGKADEVLETRLAATQVRADLGLPTGRILRRIQGSNELPDVIWECEFPSVEAHDRDMNARANSPNFEGARARMRTLLRGFERSVWDLAGPPGARATTINASGSFDEAAPAGGIVVFNWYYANPGLEEEMLAHRLHASDVRGQLGRGLGRVFHRLSDGDGFADLPEVLWQMDYANVQAREADSEGVSDTPEFQAVMEKMGTLTRAFDRGLYEIQ